MLEKLTYIEGYRSGQHDALTWLSVKNTDDAPLVEFDQSVQFRAAMVCLTANLRAVGGLCVAAATEREACAAWIDNLGDYGMHGMRTLAAVIRAGGHVRPGHALPATTGTTRGGE